MYTMLIIAREVWSDMFTVNEGEKQLTLITWQIIKNITQLEQFKTGRPAKHNVYIAITWQEHRIHTYNLDMTSIYSSLYSTRTRGHPYKLYLHNRFIDVRKYFFCERIVITWNNLPATSEHFSIFSQFKCFINSVDLTSHVSLGF